MFYIPTYNYFGSLRFYIRRMKNDCYKKKEKRKNTHTQIYIYIDIIQY